MKRTDYGIIIFGLIEIIVGSVTLIAVMVSLLLGKSEKPPEVLIFVLATSSISFGLGIGIFRHSLTSYHLLLFFSTVVVLSKILLFANIIALSGALETAIPQSTKNIVSIFYHILVILYFTRPPVRNKFGERRSDL